MAGAGTIGWLVASSFSEMVTSGKSLDYLWKEERLTTDNEKHRIYMRAVRDADGQVLGYYERYEPPAG